MLKTPFGNIIIELNDRVIDYKTEELPLVSRSDDFTLFSVEGRYKITPLIKEAYYPFRLKCLVDCSPDMVDGSRSGLSTGERVFLNDLRSKNLKMNIGSFDEMDGLEGYGYTYNGIEIIVSDDAHIKSAFFCVAWMTLSSDNDETNNEIYTWFAADPGYL